jgi:RNA polymerase sigma factor (sigma-70 family)
MSETPLDTVRLQSWIQRWQAGDRDAADELIQACAGRLELLARKMLRAFPTVQGQTQTEDVLQGCLVRLLNALRSLVPKDTREFYGLAAVQVRRELLDLARQFARRPATARGEPGNLAEVAERREAPEDLEMWCRFHQEVENLPVEQREVFGLAFYHGWTQGQMAQLLGVDERTIRRHWRNATLRLAETLGSRLPGL